MRTLQAVQASKGSKHQHLQPRLPRSTKSPLKTQRGQSAVPGLCFSRDTLAFPVIDLCSSYKFTHIFYTEFYLYIKTNKVHHKSQFLNYHHLFNFGTVPKHVWEAEDYRKLLASLALRHQTFQRSGTWKTSANLSEVNHHCFMWFRLESIMKHFLCAEILLTPQNRIAWLVWIWSSQSQKGGFVSFNHPLVALTRLPLTLSLRLWQQEKISELTMDVSKDLARDFHLERFTIQEFYADRERQNLNPDKRPWAQACAWKVVSWKYSSPYHIQSFPCLAWEGNNAKSGPLSGKAAMQARADTLRSIPENLSERVGRRSPSNCSRLAAALAVSKVKYPTPSCLIHRVGAQ